MSENPARSELASSVSVSGSWRSNALLPIALAVRDVERPESPNDRERTDQTRDRAGNQRDQQEDEDPRTADT